MREDLLTHHRGGGQQFRIAGLLPAVLERTGTLAGFALEHNVLPLLRGAVGVAPRLGRLHCGRQWECLEKSGAIVMTDKVLTLQCCNDLPTTGGIAEHTVQTSVSQHLSHYSGSQSCLTGSHLCGRILFSLF